MKRKKLFKRGIVAILCAVMFVSCFKIDDITNVNTDVLLPDELMLPIGRFNMNIGQILSQIDFQSDYVEVDYENDNNDVNVIIEEESGWKFKQIIFDSLGVVSVFDTLKLDYFFASELPSGFEFNLSGEIKERFEMNINMEGERDPQKATEAYIDSIVFSTIVLELNILEDDEIDLNQLEIVTVFDPKNVVQLDDNDNRLSTQVMGTVSNINQKNELSFSNILLRPAVVEEDNAIQNKLPMDVIIRSKVGGITVNNQSRIKFEYLVKSVDYKIAYGVFPATVADKHTETFDFDLSTFNGIFFANPTIDLSVASNVGTYFYMYIDSIKAYRKEAPESAVYAAFMQGGVEAESYFVNFDDRPRVPGVFAKKDGIAKFDKDNGKTDRLFNMEDGNTPDRLEYTYSMKAYAMDPDKYPNIPFFITPDAEVKVKARATIPLQLNAGSTFTLNDTIADMKLDSIMPENIGIQEAFLMLKVVNGLPTDVKFTMTDFYNKSGENITGDITIRKDYSIAKADIDAEGIVKAPKESIIKIELTEAQYEEFRNVDDILFELKVNEDKGKMYLKTTDFININLGAYVKGKIATSAFNSESNEENN